MRNKYPGQCYRCGETVAPGAGHFERKPGGGWRTQHAECAITHRGTDLGKEGATEARKAARIKRLHRNAKLTGNVGQRARAELRRMGLLAPSGQNAQIGTSQ